MADPTPTSITRPKGFRAAGGTCGIKESGKPDLALVVADEPCTAAGVFTTNKVPGAAVRIGKKHLRRCRDTGARAIVCNSGNANVATGRNEADDTIAMCRAAAEAVGCAPHQVLPASTGVIGRPLPIEKITRGIHGVAGTLRRGAKADHAAATGIMTTDSRPKSAVRTYTLGGAKITIAGITKGAAMIAPNMATTLGFLTTDADVKPEVLQAALRDAAAVSYNRISIDGDQSTSDTLYLLASGKAGNRPISRTSGPVYENFTLVLSHVALDLAEQIMRDAEGGTKVFRVEVRGAKSMRDADRVGRAVAESPLVKCAVAGADPNWGRIAMAVGNSGAHVNQERLRISIAYRAVYKDGLPMPLTPAEERKLSEKMKRKDVILSIDLGAGDAGCDWLGCDLTADYVRLNADYTT